MDAKTRNIAIRFGKFVKSGDPIYKQFVRDYVVKLSEFPSMDVLFSYWLTEVYEKEEYAISIASVS